MLTPHECIENMQTLNKLLRGYFGRQATLFEEVNVDRKRKRDELGNRAAMEMKVREMEAEKERKRKEKKEAALLQKEKQKHNEEFEKLFRIFFNYLNFSLLMFHIFHLNFILFYFICILISGICQARKKFTIL